MTRDEFQVDTGEVEGVPVWFGMVPRDYGLYKGWLSEMKDLPHGHGVWVSDVSQEVYIGSFRKGKKDGKGVYRNDKGEIIAAMFSDDRFNGPMVSSSFIGIVFDTLYTGTMFS